MSALQNFVRRQKLYFGLKEYFAHQEPTGPWAEYAAIRGADNPATQVLHIGAYMAEERRVYEMMGAREVIWVEGSSTNFRQLKRCLERDEKRGIASARHRAIHALLADKPGLEFTLKGFDKEKGSNSIFRATSHFAERFPGMTQNGLSETCVSTTLDKLAAEHGFSSPDLLVIDVEGAELMALGGGTKTLAGTSAVIAEVANLEIYSGGVAANDLVAFLADHGFTLHGDLPEATGNVLFLRT
jgi:FkbM family methyltransferase